MKRRYIVWIRVEECEVEGEDYSTIAAVGEARQAGCFGTERSACEHVDYLLEQTALRCSHPQSTRNDE